MCGHWYWPCLPVAFYWVWSGSSRTFLSHPWWAECCYLQGYIAYTATIEMYISCYDWKWQMTLLMLCKGPKSPLLWCGATWQSPVTVPRAICWWMVDILLPIVISWSWTGKLFQHCCCPDWHKDTCVAWEVPVSQTAISPESYHWRMMWAWWWLLSQYHVANHTTTGRPASGDRWYKTQM